MKTQLDISKVQAHASMLPFNLEKEESEEDGVKSIILRSTYTRASVEKELAISGHTFADAYVEDQATLSMDFAGWFDMSAVIPVDCICTGLWCETNDETITACIEFEV